MRHKGGLLICMSKRLNNLSCLKQKIATVMAMSNDTVRLEAALPRLDRVVAAAEAAAQALHHENKRVMKPSSALAALETGRTMTIG